MHMAKRASEARAANLLERVVTASDKLHDLKANRRRFTLAGWIVRGQKLHLELGSALRDSREFLGIGR